MANTAKKEQTEQKANTPAPVQPLAIPSRAKNNSLKPLGYFCEIKQHRMKEGTTLEDLLRVNYWDHVSHDLKPDDLVYCLGERFNAILVVINSSDRNGAQMNLFAYTEKPPVEALRDNQDDFEIKDDRGRTHPHGTAPWNIIRKQDGQVMAEQIPSYDRAVLQRQEMARNAHK